MNIYHLTIGQHEYSFQVKGKHISVFNKNEEKPFLEFEKSDVNVTGIKQDTFWQTQIAGNYFQGQIERLRAEETLEFDGKVKATGPGRIAKMHVEAGQSVAKDEVLCTIEAMKMEYPISTPVAGTVKNILVSLGDQVERGSLLIEITIA